MSLNHGRDLLAIPGPSIVPERVLNAMHRPSPNIYGGALYDLVDGLIPDLQEVAQTSSNVAIYIGNGHAAWEAALANSFVAGDQVLCLYTGRFAELWGAMAAQRGIVVEPMDFSMQGCVDPDMVADRLRKDKDHNIKAVLTVQSDTASSVRNDILALRQAIDSANHPALFFVDCICSLGCEEHRMDAWGVDVMLSACQKGLMTPAGLAFIWYNEKAKTARARTNPSWYWDWVPRSEPEVFYQLFGGTAPTHHLFGLREALTMLLREEGLEAAWARHRVHARMVWAAVEAWGMAHNIANPEQRSFAVSSIKTAPNIAGVLREWCEAQGGITLGVGLGLAQMGTPEWDQQFRIGHMGHLNPAMVMATLGVIDAGLKANNLAHGAGALDAATAALAANLAIEFPNGGMK